MRISTTITCRSRQSQGQLSGFVRAKPAAAAMMSKDSEEYLDITDKLIQVIGTTYQSLALVESQDFRQFVCALNPR